MPSHSLNASTLITHEPCPKCGSRDNLGRYSDGHGYCFGCGYWEAGEGQANNSTRREPMSKDLIQAGRPMGMSKRLITQETCEKWGYTVGKYKGQTVQIANYRDTAGRIVAQKIRTSNKEFIFLGDATKAGLYGQHLWRDGGKRVTVTEGEVDALTVSQVQGNQWPVVSLPTGAKGARKALQKSFEWLCQFEEVILMFDNDEAGRAAVEDCATLGFKAGQLKIAKLPLKDANEMLTAGRGREIVSAIFDAKAYRPDGILHGVDLWERLNAVDDNIGYELPFRELQHKTLGIRRGELWTFTAGSGVGKTSIVREMAYHLLQNGLTIGMIMLEENIKRTAQGLIGLAVDAPAHSVWDELDEATRRKGFDATLGTGRLYLYDHFGSTNLENIATRIRYMAAGCECNVIILDHLSIVVSGSDEGVERRMIDNIMTALKTLCMELNIAILLVSHLKRPLGDKGHEEGAQTSLAQLRGSAAIAQLSDFVIGAERNQQSQDKNTTTLRILKNRFTGETGEAGFLSYTPETGRLTELFSNPFEQLGEDEDDATIRDTF